MGASPPAPIAAARPAYRDVSSSEARRQWGISNARAAERATASAAAESAAAQQRQQRARDQAMGGIAALGAKYSAPVMTTFAPPATAPTPAPMAALPSRPPGQLAATANAGLTPAAAARAAQTRPTPAADFGNVQAGATLAPTPPAARSPGAGPRVNVISPTRTDFGTVRPPTRRPTPAQGGVVTAAGSEGAGQAPGGRTIDGRPNGLSSSLNTQGNQVYDNASIRRLEQRLDQGGGATTSAATASGQFPAATPEASRMAARPVASGGIGASIGNPDEDRRRLQIALDSATRRPARSRGERAAQAQLVEGIMGEFGQRQQIAADGVNANLDATTRQGIASQDRDARLQEAQMDNATRLQERAMQVAGEERVQRMARRPEPITTADGTLGTIGEDGTFTPVTDRDGQVVRGARQRDASGLTADALLKSYTDQKSAIRADQTLLPEQRDAAIQALDQDPLFAPLRQGTSAGVSAQGPGGLTVAGTSPDGRTVYRDAAGNLFTDE